MPAVADLRQGREQLSKISSYNLRANLFGGGQGRAWNGTMMLILMAKAPWTTFSQGPKKLGMWDSMRNHTDEVYFQESTSLMRG